MLQLKKLYKFLKEDKEIKNYLFKLQTISLQFQQIEPEKFSHSELMETLRDELNNLFLEPLESIMKNMPNLPEITGVILKACEAYTIAFLIIPPNTTFDWHDHINMNGISRCVSGKLIIRSLNPLNLQKIENPKQEKKEKKDIQSEQIYFSIEQCKVKEEELNATTNKISIIFPHTYNIHQIKSKSHQSSFLDILVPQYPDNSCNYFIPFTHLNQPDSVEVKKQEGVIESQNKKILLKKTKNCQQKIVGIESAVQYFKQNNIN